MKNEPHGDRLRVVLVATRNPLNIGAAARAMSNFGFSRLRVVNPYEVAFREARSAVGASAVLASAEQYKNVTEAVADCTLVVGTTALGHGNCSIRSDDWNTVPDSFGSASPRAVSRFCSAQRRSAYRMKNLSVTATG